MTMSEQMNSQIATWIGVASAGAQVYHGEEGRRIQKKSFSNQVKAQQESEARARSQQRRQEEVARRSTSREPNIAALLAQSQRFGSSGVSSTQLSGPLRTPLGGR